jgi:uroporphyrinogen-III decarboxylase
MFKKPEYWGKLGPEERRKIRLDYWESGEWIAFDTHEAAEGYKIKVRLLRDAVEMKKGDRVPVVPTIGGHLLKRAGLSGKDALYNYELISKPIIDFHKEFNPDTAILPMMGSGKVWEILDYKLYAWAGHGLPDHHYFQTVDKEYMGDDEYSLLIGDPSGFWLKHYLPRVFGAMEPLKKMFEIPTLTEIVHVGGAVLPFGMPDVQEMLKKLMDAGNEAMKYTGVFMKLGTQLQSSGFPTLKSGFAKAPFDMIGDTMRGVKGMVMDMYRRPNDVIAACEKLVPIVIRDAIEACDRMGAAFVFFPLHKGADTFMSPDQFKRFYWPSLRAVMESLNTEGIIPILFAEGSYNKRLEIIADYPKGWSLWYFDQTDMRKAKEVLGGTACIQGNVPSSLMTTAPVDQLRAYCEDLLDIFKDSGGFILANGAVLDDSTDEHVRTLIEVVRKQP